MNKMSDKPEEMLDNETDRPLVTFALFAYNQEQYIREAVGGAFAQTYEPLEIILSDDSSSDRTFEIMKEMAATYEGPHEIHVRREAQNIGTLGHVRAVSKVAAGEIMIVAAGDDISLPARTEKLVTLFTKPIVVAGSSNDLIIDESGKLLSIDEDRIVKRDNWHSTDVTWVHGATAAYRVSFLRKLPESDRKLLFEDQIISDFMKGIDCHSFRTKDRLIKYRYHTQNLSSRHEMNIDEAEAAAMQRWQRASEAKEYCASALISLPSSRSTTNEIVKKLRAEQQFLELMARWPKINLIDKVRLLRMAVARKKPRTAMIRLFGYSFFKLVRQFQNREYSR